MLRSLYSGISGLRAEQTMLDVTANDTDLASGAPGIMANGAATADNWAGGDVVGTWSVGGTLSGLSTGPVVLQALQDAGFIEVHKDGAGRTQSTVCRITPTGRRRFAEYLNVLESVVTDALPGTTRDSSRCEARRARSASSRTTSPPVRSTVRSTSTSG